MATYLLNWNPRRWDWFELEAEIVDLQEKGWLEARWSCGVTKRILPGDRFFLIRLGMPPKGIMASGTIKSRPFVEPHWDGDLAESGKQALFVDVVFDSLLNPQIDQILGLDTLQNSEVLRQMNWITQASGVHIPDDIAYELQDRWSEFLMVDLPATELNEPKFVEGAARVVTLTTYERNIAARHQCVEYYGAKCIICNFDFKKVYGSVGEGYIQVHHIVPLSEIGEKYTIDPSRDLVPVCPNCHAIIHRRTPCYSIEEMRTFLRPHQKDAPESP